MYISFSCGCQEIQNQMYYLNVINYVEQYGRIFVQIFYLILFFYFNLYISQFSFFYLFIFSTSVSHLIFIKMEVYAYANHIYTNYTHMYVSLVIRMITILVLYIYKKRAIIWNRNKIGYTGLLIVENYFNVFNKSLWAIYQYTERAILHFNGIFFNVILLNTNEDLEFLESNF